LSAVIKEEDSGNNSPQSHKVLRKRKTKNKSQRDTLKHYYGIDRYPSQEKMSELALKLKLSYYQVYKWFWEQNRKQGSEK